MDAASNSTSQTLRRTSLLALPLLMAAACATGLAPTDPDRVTRPLQRQHAAALAREAVLYPFHFASTSAELNSLGHRVLGVIMAEGDAAPRRVRLSPTAYGDEASGDARIQSVEAYLQSVGFTEDQFMVLRGTAGGRGVAVQKVIARRDLFQQRPMNGGGALPLGSSR